MNDIIGELNTMFDEALEGADHETLGEKLRKKRTSLNLKLVDIARITGLSESIVGKIESDKIDDIKISTMKKLSIAYDVSPDLFITHMGLDETLAQMPQKMNNISQARILLMESDKTASRNKEKIEVKVELREPDLSKAPMKFKILLKNNIEYLNEKELVGLAQSEGLSWEKLTSSLTYQTNGETAMTFLINKGYSLQSVPLSDYYIGLAINKFGSVFGKKAEELIILGKTIESEKERKQE